MRRALRALAALLALGALPVHAAARLPFRNYQTSDGLPQSQVLAIYQDRRSEIWFGTWCGLARFDGARFRYLTQLSGLPSNYVRDVVEDASGSIWIAAGNGVVRLAAGPQTRIVEIVDPLIPSARDSAIRDLMLDSRGVLWAASQSDGVAYREGNAFVPVSTPEVDTDSFQLLAEPEPGRVVVATTLGLRTIRDGHALPYRDGPGPWNEPVWMVYSPAPGELVFATPRGVYRNSRAGFAEIRSAQGLPIPAGRVAHRDHHGRLWIGTDDGLYRETESGFVRLGPAEGLIHEHVYSILEDREGNLWFGTDAGLSRLPGEETFRTFYGASVFDKGVWGLATDRSGQVLAATTGGALRFAGDAFARWPGPNPLEGLTLRTVLDAGDDGVWFGTSRDGLFQQQGGHFRQFLPPEIPDARVYCSHRDPNGDLWFGGRRGVLRYRAGRFEAWTRENGLPDDTVWSFADDPEGHLVLATDGGVVVWDGARFAVPPHFARFKQTSVRKVVFAADGSIWVGTNGLGLARYAKGAWKDYHTGDGLSDDFIWGLVEDARGRLWAATNHGIDIYDGRRWTNFSVRDGLPDNEIAVNAAAAARDGSVWFGFLAPPAVVRFSSDPLGGADLPPIPRVSAVETPAREEVEPSNLTLPWSERDLTFSYIGVSFRDERRVRYRTRLEGYDPGWGADTASRSVRYTNLEPGRYRFLVLAQSAGGTWSPEPAAVSIEILAPFWRTTLFRAGAALSAIALLGLGLRLRLRRLTAETHQLEELVSQRTQSLQEQVRETERLKEEFERLSVTDPLTGISNRRFFLEQLEREASFARRHTQALGVLMIDVDRFKDVNDRFGHQIGDRALVFLVQILAGSIRKTDLLARYGGEEFVIAFLNTDRDGCLERSERLRRKLAETPLDLEGGEPVRITFSAGLVWHDYAHGNSEIDDLIRKADRALYRAKANGRNRVTVWEE